MHELNPDVLDNEAPLIEGGIIDSMSLINLIKFVEGKFGIGITEDEWDIDNFQTVNALAGFIKGKMAALPGN